MKLLKGEYYSCPLGMFKVIEADESLANVILWDPVKDKISPITIVLSTLVYVTKVAKLKGILKIME